MSRLSVTDRRLLYRYRPIHTPRFDDQMVKPRVLVDVCDIVADSLVFDSYGERPAADGAVDGDAEGPRARSVFVRGRPLEAPLTGFNVEGLGLHVPATGPGLDRPPSDDNGPGRFRRGVAGAEQQGDGDRNEAGFQRLSLALVVTVSLFWIRQSWIRRLPVRADCEFLAGEDRASLIDGHSVHAAVTARQPDRLVGQVVGMEHDSDAGPVAKRDVL